MGLPAGGIEPGESPAQAVAREVKEETGLVVRPVRLAGVFGGTAGRTRYPNGDEVEYTVCVFDCAVVGGAPSLGGEETVDLGWFAPAEALGRLDFPYPLELLDGSATAAWFQAERDSPATKRR